MAAEKIPLSYKGRPLRRKDNLIYYGTMAEKYIIMLQVLNTKKVEGLDVATKVLRSVDGISFCSLTSKDVVRHPLVQQIVKAYETYEAKENARSRERGREKERTRRIRRQ